MANRHIAGLLALLLLVGVRAEAGGTPEEAFLIVDPTRTDAMYLANYYMAARDVPAINALYIDPTASDYFQFADENIPALLGTLANLGIRDHSDYMIIPTASSFYVYTPGLITDNCVGLNRLSLASAYTLALIEERILSGEMISTRSNRYASTDNVPLAFDSEILWRQGYPSDTGTGQRYFLGAMLGYTGERGNTVAEIAAMIDRSVAADGTLPGGTFYYMETTDSARSDPRDIYFDWIIGLIIDAGGNAEHLYEVLPLGRYDALGIMTGWAAPDIEGGDFAILPGAFCDHLTSWAATFDIASQTKVSSWIRKGASASWGTVEEPCNYPGKFPHARIHLYYFLGLSAGEAVYRSVNFIPFQGLFYGDPLTRPFAYLPSVSVTDLPGGVVSGTIAFTPAAVASYPGAQIARLDLLVDGVLHDSIAPGDQFVVDTTTLGDGYHELRVLAFDDTNQRFTGRWRGELLSDNRGRSVSGTVSPASGDWNTLFTVNYNATAADLVEVRLLHNGRVVAADSAATGQLAVYGLTLGAGPAQVQLEALYGDGRRVRSAPQQLDIAYSGPAPAGAPPVAFSYTKTVVAREPFVVELPATCDDPNATLTFTLLSTPAQAAILNPGASGPYRIMQPDPLAEGSDTFVFQVDSPTGASNEATVTIVYDNCVGDIDGDGQVDLADLAILLANYNASDAAFEQGDINLDGVVDLNDLSVLLAHYGNVCN